MERIEQTAYAWVQQRAEGLSAEKATELKAWLAADFRHERAFAEYLKNWDRFEALEETVRTGDYGSIRKGAATSAPEALADTESVRRMTFVRRVAPYLATAAAVAIGFAIWRQPWHQAAPELPAPLSLSLPAPCEQRTLADGSRVELNRGAEIDVQYGEKERLVRLLRGEANFTVAKNPDRPFIVEAAGVKVRAVGTVFNVRFDPRAVNVVVTEGKVRVDAPAVASSDPHATTASSFVEAGQKTVVPLAVADASPQVVTLAQPELAQELLWQPKLLDFDNVTLSQIAAEFNQRNPVRLVIENQTTGERRMTAAFRSDNVEGFVRLLESNFGIKAQRVNERDIVLTEK